MIMDRVMRTIFFVCFLLGVIQTCKAQDTMRIHFKNGGHKSRWIASRLSRVVKLLLQK